MSSKRILDVKWIPAVGSALGAVTSAVVLSTLGVGGTLIGAALGSLLITIGGSAYSQSLQRTTAHVGSKVANARNRTGQRNTTGTGSTAYAPDPAGASTDDKGSASNASPSKVVRTMPWKRILVSAAALFAIAMAVILAFELTTGRAVSSYTGGSSGTGGGTSIPGIGTNPDGTGNDTDPREAEPTDTQPSQQDQEPTQEQPPQEDQEPTDVQPSQEEQEPTDVQPSQEEQEPAPAEEAPTPPDAPLEPAPAPEQPAAP